MAISQAEWNATLGIPCEFILLNSPSPRAPQDGRDFVRVDASRGDTKAQCAALASLLQRTYPGGSTPLTERLGELNHRICASMPGLSRTGRKVMLCLVTDGVPNGHRSHFVQALRHFAQTLPVSVVARLCTNDDNVMQFYDAVDREVELSLDIVDDLHGEARNISWKNPWLSYSPTLHSIREAGTLIKLLDLIDERELTPMETSLCAQLLVRNQEAPPYPREPEAFLHAVEKDLSGAPWVFDVYSGKFAPAIKIDKLRAAVHPRKYALSSRALEGIGLGVVADWWYLGKRPWEEQEADAASKVPARLEVTSAPNLPSLPVKSQQIEYYSTTHASWMPCVVADVDCNNASIMINIKLGAWITMQQLLQTRFEVDTDWGWSAYDELISRGIAIALMNGEAEYKFSLMNVSHNPLPYVVDLRTMEQINAITQKRRKVRPQGSCIRCLPQNFSDLAVNQVNNMMNMSITL